MFIKADEYSEDPLLLSKRAPELTAKIPIITWQMVFIIFLSLVIIAGAIWYPWCIAKTFIAFCTIFYLLSTVYKFILMRHAISHQAEIQISEEELNRLKNDDLPDYSILVPMYHEAESVADIVIAIKQLDYPEDKLDVQLVLEEDDMETLNAVNQTKLPANIRVTLVPPSLPRTKPKACNVALARARGKYLVIYDAEDRPEPDQLRKAVAAFRRLPSNIICLQSKLNYYNPRQNLLSRWFTIEYSTWFDLFLPGLSKCGGMIPLGGTSNHFVTDKLKELMGWDAYNVTEDCDLGVRIYRAGYKSRMLNTTTWEEACCVLPYWIRQRTRWLKGYIQTYLVHMRHPLRFIKDVGIINFLHFHALIAGVVFACLINPLYWILALTWFCFRVEAMVELFPFWIFAIGALCLFVGNFVFVYAGAVGTFKRRYYDLVKYSLLSPLYWIMMSYCGWRALLQFFANPFLWEKTRHGLATYVEPNS
jgi:cellulose synthase/poly-beta-1,6-N-acetylglucosamine synthase-like glycosyltransferase